jgi:hypothetical protein
MLSLNISILNVYVLTPNVFVFAGHGAGPVDTVPGIGGR